MKGIVLAGGYGTRLYPLTICLSKQLLPVYDKPMVYYPITTLMLAGIRDILIITTSDDLTLFTQLLGDGSAWGCTFTYAVQKEAKGIAEAFLIGENFIGNDNVSLILGDNIFFAQGLSPRLRQVASNEDEATVFCYQVRDPERYGVAEMDEGGRILSIEEKPGIAKSNWVVTGLYFYDNDVIEIAKSMQPSLRGELEITSINLEYLKQGRLKGEQLGRGAAWLDTGSHDSLLEAAQFVEVVERRQGLKIGCPEEVAWRMGYIDDAQLEILAKNHVVSGYGGYLKNIIESHR